MCGWRNEWIRCKASKTPIPNRQGDGRNRSRFGARQTLGFVGWRHFWKFLSVVVFFAKQVDRGTGHESHIAEKNIVRIGSQPEISSILYSIFCWFPVPARFDARRVIADNKSLTKDQASNEKKTAVTAVVVGAAGSSGALVVASLPPQKQERQRQGQ